MAKKKKRRRKNALVLPGARRVTESLMDVPGQPHPIRSMLRRLGPGGAEIAMSAIGRAFGVDTSPLLMAGITRRLGAQFGAQFGHGPAREPVAEDDLLDRSGATLALSGPDRYAQGTYGPGPSSEPETAPIMDRVGVVLARTVRMMALAHDENEPRAREKMAALAAELNDYANAWLTELARETGASAARERQAAQGPIGWCIWSRDRLDPTAVHYFPRGPHHPAACGLDVSQALDWDALPEDGLARYGACPRCLSLRVQLRADEA